MKKSSLLFWQPHLDYLKLLTRSQIGQKLLIVLNYLIWVIFFYFSYLLIKNDVNYFWRILFATIFSEITERYLKSKVYWRRPMFVRHDQTPVGLVDKWYRTGSFPSGHALKAAYFFVFTLISGVFPPLAFLAVILPLLVFRVFIGFHYPIDLLGGIVIGVFTWSITQWLAFPEFLNHFVRVIFNFVFFIRNQ